MKASRLSHHSSPPGTFDGDWDLLHDSQKYRRNTPSHRSPRFTSWLALRHGHASGTAWVRPIVTSEQERWLVSHERPDGLRNEYLIEAERNVVPLSIEGRTQWFGLACRFGSSKQVSQMFRDAAFGTKLQPEVPAYLGEIEQARLAPSAADLDPAFGCG